MKLRSCVSSGTAVGAVVLGLTIGVMQGQAEQAAAPKAPAKAPAPAAGRTGGAALTPLTDAASIGKGKAIFESTTSMCVTCHKPDLGGLIGPNLTDTLWIHGCSFPEIIKNITTGFPDKGMQPFGSGAKLTDEQLRQVASYVVSKKGTNPPGAKPVDPAREKPCK